MAAGPDTTPSPTASKASPSLSESPTPDPKPETPAAPPTKTPKPAPGPTSSAPGPKPPVLFVSLSVPGGKVRSGDSVTAAVHVHATTAKANRTFLRLTAGGRPTPAVSKCTAAKGLCNLGVVGESAKVVYATVQIPKDIKSGSVTLTATVSAQGALSKTDGRTIPVTKRIVKPSPTPTPTPTPTNTGGSGTTTGNNNNSTGTGTGTGGYRPPSTNSTFNKPPQVALPPIAPPTPSVAPGQATPSVPTSTLRSNNRATQQLTFERMASTQAAWLAALMVAFSLLLTQIRLGRRSSVPSSAKGAHRRSRRGAFGR